ncbi:MAG: hypothetical protein GX102_05175 [Porphyromonadaceae bacterium]|nr:hypothetical protein [Porphyromonadaceae bacterium]
MKANYFKNLVVLMVIVAILAACNKNENQPEKIKPPTKAAFNELRNKALTNLTQTKTFKAEEGITFTSDKGAVLNIPANCLMDEENNPVTGEVAMSFIEIYDKGNMVVTNKPVMGLDPDTNDPRPLITGGQYNIEIKQGNKKLYPSCYYNIKIKGSHTGGVDHEMVLWNGIIDDETGNLVYEEENDQRAGIEKGEDMVNYSVLNNRFDWTNIDKFWNYDGPKTRIKVNVPNGYDGDNSAVYAVFDDQKNALAQLDVYHSEDKYFTEHYGFVPVGKKLHLVFVSESNGSAVYAIKSVTIETNQAITIVDTELMVGTLNQVVALVNGLN